MSCDITLNQVGSNIRDYLSGMTRERVRLFCTETGEYVISFVRNIPEYMQQSHLKAGAVLFVVNALFLVFLNFIILSPLERKIKTISTDQDQLLWKKNILNVVVIGIGCIAYNISLTQLHKYQLSRIQLLFITISAIIYRRFNP